MDKKKKTKNKEWEKKRNWAIETQKRNLSIQIAVRTYVYYYVLLYIKLITRTNYYGLRFQTVEYDENDDDAQ